MIAQINGHMDITVDYELTYAVNLVETSLVDTQKMVTIWVFSRAGRLSIAINIGYISMEPVICIP